MDDNPLPIVDGCYIDNQGSMFKVKLVELQAGLPVSILMEDLYSKLHRISLNQWLRKPMIPCCMTRNLGTPGLSATSMSAGQALRPNQT